jgi:hypothetical protein
MSGMLVSLPALVAVLVLPGGLVWLAGRSRPSTELLPATAAARRHAVTGGLISTAVGLLLLVGLLSAWSATSVGHLRLVAAAPTLAAAGSVAVLALTERTWPRPTGTVRSVRLDARTVGSVAPPRLARVFLVAAAVLTAVVLVGTLLADATQQGLTVTGSVVQHGETLEVTGRASPFPGLVYGGSALLGAAVLVVSVAGTLRLVVIRPAVPAADAATDLALRRASAHRVLRAGTVGLTATSAALLLVGGITARSVAGDGYGWQGAAGLALAGALAVATVVVALWPAPSVPAPVTEPVAG